MSQTQKANAKVAAKQAKAPNKKNHLDPRDFIPVQYLCTLYNKDLLQGIFNKHIDDLGVNVLVNAVRRSNHGTLVRFGLDNAKARTKALMDCVQYCVTGEVAEDCTDPYTAIYAWLYTSKEEDAELRIFYLKRFLKSRNIVVKIKGVDVPETPMAQQLQNFAEERKVEAIATLFDKIINQGRPRFVRVDNEVQEPQVSDEKPIEFDEVVRGEVVDA